MKSTGSSSDQIEDLKKEIAKLKQEIKELKADRLHLEEREKIEEEAITRTSELEAILSCIADGVIVYDKHGRIVRMNAVAEKLLNYPKEETELEMEERISRGYGVWTEDGRQLKAEEMPAFRASVQAETIKNEVLLIKGSEDPHWISISAAPLIVFGSHIGGVASLSDITDRKKAEEALRRSEENYRLLFDSMVEGYQVVEVLYDEHGKPMDLLTLDINPACSEQNGIPIEQAKGHRVSKVLGYLEPVWLDRPHEVVSQQKTVRFEEYSTALGRWYSIVAFPLPVKNRLGVISYDVTDIRRSQQKLKENEQRLRGIYDNAGVGISETDIDNRLLDINDRFFNILGYTREELIGKSVIDITYAEDIQLTNIMNDRLHKGEIEMFNYEKRYIKKDGSLMWVNVTGSAMFDSDGKFIKSINTIEDITERKNAEDAIRRSETILKQAGMIANLGVWEIEFLQWDDINKNPLHWSDQTYRIFGYSPGAVAVTNDLFMAHIPPEDGQRLSDSLTEAIDKRSSYRIEHRIRRTDGIERMVVENAEITYDNAGKPVRIIGTVQDITEQKLVEQKLIKAKEKAEESDRLKSAFIANLSHEIRTPMNGILGFADLLNTPNLSEESQKMYVDAISSSGKRMLDIIFDLIDISKLESGQMEIKIDIVDISRVLDELFIFFLPEANKKGVMLKFNKELPPDKILIETDKTKLMQILTNLIKNALKFTSRGYVEFGCEIEGNNYLFYVKDTGIGVKKEFHEQIFERFRQGDVTPSGIYEGTGLGLAISKAYVELLGGKISVESEPSKGSLFSFIIPFKELKLAKSSVVKKDEKVAESTAISAIGDSIPCSTILVADDDESIYFYLQQLLKLNNLETLHARDGLEAVEVIKSNSNIDLVLMDIKMPRMDGLEATRQIRAIKSGIPIIAQSAFNTDVDIQKAFEAGCNDYISKPFNRENLLNKIVKHCAS
jgi:PAS domain S-box-containing protein